MMLFKKKKTMVPPEGQSYLITVEDNVEADLLEAELAASGITVFRSYRESGAYLTLLMGKSSFGVDLFVPSEKLEEAKTIISSAQQIKDEDILSDPSFSDKALQAENEEFLNKLDRRVWWMAGFFIAAVILVICLALFR